MTTHKCDFAYNGVLVYSTDKEINGLYEWICSGCGSEMYSEGIKPTGKIVVRHSGRRYRNDKEKVKRGK